MQQVLMKRVPRSLRKHLVRYLALFLMIACSMFLIVSVMATADLVITQGYDYDDACLCEDGEFTTFVPLTGDDLDSLTKDGTSVEDMFSLDFTSDAFNDTFTESATLRLFKNRQNINLVHVVEGEAASDENDVAVERRFAEVHNLAPGDTLTIGGKKLTVSGIVTIPDYNAPYKNLADTAVDSEAFGTAFVTGDTYNTLLKSGKADRSEDYLYAYRLTGTMDDEDLKDKLKDVTVSAEDIDDEAFQAYWKETGAVADDLLDAVDELAKGSADLADGLNTLDSKSGTLTKAANTILSSYLSRASSSLKEAGVSVTLTEDNYESVLNKAIQSADSAVMRLSLSNLESTLSSLIDFRDGLDAYTDGVGEASDGSDTLSESLDELCKETNAAVEELVGSTALSNMTMFLKRADNIRIDAAAADQYVNLYSCYGVEIIIIIMFAYVISVFVIHQIENEEAIIGTFYALGVRQSELLLHYVTLPVVVTFLAGLTGTVLGYSPMGIASQAVDVYGYYSVPDLILKIKPFFVFYGVIVPPLIALVVNVIVIRRHLSRTPLSLLRGEGNRTGVSHVSLKSDNYVSMFRMRQLLKEWRSAFGVLFGMFIVLLLGMMVLDCGVMCENVKVDNAADTTYEYMYTYKYPYGDVPEGGTQACCETLKKATLGYDFDVMVMGIEPDNKYFDFTDPGSESAGVISSALSQKFGVKEGDILTLRDEENDRLYAFEVTDVIQYAPSYVVFMDIDDVRDLFGQSDDYFNVVFSNKALDIDSGRLYSTTTKTDIEHAASIFVDMMMSMIIMMSVVCVLIFVTVMYLMMKIMIDRSAQSIALMKVFGYTRGEIRTLFLDGNFLIVAVGAAVIIPLSKVLMDALYPLLVSNVPSGMDLAFDWWMYAALYAVIIVFYLLVSRVLVRRIDKIVPAEVLKNRE